MSREEGEESRSVTSLGVSLDSRCFFVAGRGPHSLVGLLQKVAAS